ncbi:MAG: putative cobaltochelatase [Candidatus Verstraetearchaeota archaeon]|nr:putative cobaltochelatase [Candidatus Verstraetearchaeota archaeon]
MRLSRTTYPFSAIVGQDKMKLALILNVINPKIGGVLLRGEKGTGKSLAVRALANLLPEIEVVSDCPFNCDPRRPKELCSICSSKLTRGEILKTSKKPVSVIELPVGTTEDRLIGTLDIEKAIKTGEKHFEPGILAAANRNILYIDEVNLLDDHLVDVLLDSAAMGVNFVEREGISFTHPAEFVLVGTMNPEEGELRPQFLDRFALSVEVKGLTDREARAEVVRRRMAFEANPGAFIEGQRAQEDELRKKIVDAISILPDVRLSDALLGLITQICTDFKVDGHRADITIYKTACTLAAFKGRTEVSVEDVKEAAELALPHRRRKQPFEEPKMELEEIQESVERWNQNKNKESQDSRGDQSKQAGDECQKPQGSQNNEAPSKDGEGKEQVFEADQPRPVRALTSSVLDGVERGSSGRRSKSISNSRSGRYVDIAIPKEKVTDLAFDATFRAAAPFQKRRRCEAGIQGGLIIEKNDLREKVREKKVGNLIIFVVDASGSMAVEERMSAAKGAIFSLLLDAYQRRDRVGMVAFRKNTAELVLPPTNSIDLAKKCLTSLPTGGRTPMAHGLNLGLSTIRKYMWRDKEAIPLLVLVSDGRANVSLNGGDPVEEAKALARIIRSEGISSIAIDTERDFISLGLVREICGEMGGKYLPLEELTPEPIVSAVRSNLFQDLRFCS